MAFFRKLTTAYLALMAGLVLFPGLDGYAAITAGKSRAYLLLTGLYVGICLVGRLELALVGGKPLGRPRLHLTQKLILCLWAVTALSTLCSVDPALAMKGGNHWEGFWTLSLYYGSFLLVSRLAEPKPWLLGLFACAMGLNCVLAFFQYNGYNPLTLYPQGMNLEDNGRYFLGGLVGTLGSVSLHGAMLSLFLPMTFAALVTGRGKGRFWLLLPAACCVAMLLRIDVDAGYVGVVGGVVLSLPFLPKGEKSRRFCAAFVVFCAVSLLFGLIFYPDSMLGFLSEAGAVLHGQWEDHFGSYRGYIWPRVLELVPERWLLGGGPDTLGLRLQEFRDLYSKRLGVTILLELDMAHNEYLNILVNQGLPALLLYLAVLGRAAVIWVRHARHDPVIAVCGSGVLGYCLQAFFGISTPFTTSYLWLALAILVSRDPVRRHEYEPCETSHFVSESDSFGDFAPDSACFRQSE